MTLRKRLTEIESELQTDGETINRALAGDPEAIRQVRSRRQAVEHIILAKHYLNHE